jgi:uncharacterized protein YrrD
MEKLPKRSGARGGRTIDVIAEVRNVEDIGIGYEVYCGNQKVGSVARLVADASDSHITDVVVDRGLLHGAKLVPLEDVESVADTRVQLNLTHDQFIAADGFTDERFKEPEDDWSAPPGYYTQDFLLDIAVDEGGVAGYGTSGKPGPFAPSPADPRTHLLRPSVKEGTAVRVASGEKVGEIQQVRFHPDDGRLDEIVLKRGLLGREHVEIPLDWVEGLDGEALVLRVTAAEVHALSNRAPGTARTDQPD